MEQTQTQIQVQNLIATVDTKALMSVSLPDWRPLLADEVQVYVFGENYLAKRFDQINYKFCEKDEAKEILIDNLYALLRYKYFTKTSEEVDAKIKDIVLSFTQNLKTTLKKVSFDEDSSSNIVRLLPSYCLSFRNGVFNFKENKWLFKYDIIKLKNLSNELYMYDFKYIILWYLDYNFEPIEDIDVTKIKLSEMVDLMKMLTSNEKNYCFELLYNISHTAEHKFELKKLQHLCEILGYTVLQDFSQYFVMLIGSGQNGKNSLFDGCFTNRVVPRPASNDLDSIENDRFITGSLENKSHNIFLETSAKVYTESKMLKALTGSMYQTIESKGIQKYSGVINCKYIFAANDQDKTKFSDTTIGFRRRINVFEIFYRWDNRKRFLTYGDYYDTTFSDSLSELKNDVSNITIFVYFAMLGIVSATNNFTENFKFTVNDWAVKYAEVDTELQERLGNIEICDILNLIEKTDENYQLGKTAFYDMWKNRLYNSKTVELYGVKEYDELLKMLRKDEYSVEYFSNNDIFINIRLLQNLIDSKLSSTRFTQMIKRIYGITNYPLVVSNVPYVKCTFVKNKLKILAV